MTCRRASSALPQSRISLSKRPQPRHISPSSRQQRRTHGEAISGAPRSAAAPGRNSELFELKTGSRLFQGDAREHFTQLLIAAVANPALAVLENVFYRLLHGIDQIVKAGFGQTHCGCPRKIQVVQRSARRSGTRSRAIVSAQRLSAALNGCCARPAAGVESASSAVYGSDEHTS